MMKTKQKVQDILQYNSGQMILKNIKIMIRSGRHIIILAYIIIFTTLGITFNSCVAGYVASEPVYDRGYERPLSPGGAYIWIEGDWFWNNRTRVYVHHPGYWTLPREGRSFREGYWQSGPRGKSWIRGHWEREGRDRNNHDNRHDRRR